MMRGLSHLWVGGFTLLSCKLQLPSELSSEGILGLNICCGGICSGWGLMGFLGFERKSCNCVLLVSLVCLGASRDTHNLLGALGCQEDSFCREARFRNAMLAWRWVESEIYPPHRINMA